MNNLSYRIYYVWLRNMVSYQRFVIPTVLGSLGEPLLYLIAMGMGLGAYMGSIHGQPYVNFLAPGLLVSAAMFAATYECTFAAMVRMNMEKVYNSQMVTPVSVEDIIAGEICWGMTRSVMSGAVVLLILFLMGLAHGWLLLIYPVLWLVTGFLFASMGIVVTAFAPSFDFFTYYLELFLTPMFFFSGVFFPMDKFPEILKIIANFLPLTHAVIISRAIMAGQLQWQLWLNFAALLIPGILFFIWALHQMKGRLIK